VELGVDLHITMFLKMHEDIVRSAYDEMLIEMKKNANDTNSVFIESLKYDEFEEIADFVFRVRLAKHMRGKSEEMKDIIAKTPNGDLVFALTCKTFAEKLYYEHDKEENVNLIKRNVENLCEQLKSQFEAYGK